MTSHDVYRLAVAGQIDPGTIFRFLRGARVRDLSVLRIEAAAKRLRIELPPIPARAATATEPQDEQQPA